MSCMVSFQEVSLIEAPPPHTHSKELIEYLITSPFADSSMYAMETIRFINLEMSINELWFQGIQSCLQHVPLVLRVSNQIPKSDQSGPGTSFVSPVYKCGVALFCWNKPENMVSVLKEYKWSCVISCKEKLQFYLLFFLTEYNQHCYRATTGLHNILLTDWICSLMSVFLIKRADQPM